MPRRSPATFPLGDTLARLDRHFASCAAVIAGTVVAAATTTASAAVMITNLTGAIQSTPVSGNNSNASNGGIYIDFLDGTWSTTVAGLGAPHTGSGTSGAPNWNVHLISMVYTYYTGAKDYYFFAEKPKLPTGTTGQYTHIVSTPFYLNSASSQGAVLTPGITVGSSSTFDGGNRLLAMDYNDNTPPNGSNWLPGTSGYIGVQFTGYNSPGTPPNSFTPYYGWIHVTVGGTYPESLTVDQIGYETTPGVAITIPEIPGDANLDGVVNFADFVALSNHFGESGVGWAGGDFNSDGIVNFADFVILSNNFGDTQSGSSETVSAADVAALDSFTGTASVPEPASIGLLALGGLALVKRRRRAAR